MSPRDDESLDDLEAWRARVAVESERWAAEHQRIVPDLYFVMRHSGRDGERWRVIFESRSREEAQAVYDRKIPRNPNKAVSSTELCHGGLLWEHRVTSRGIAPRKVAIGVDGTVKAAHAREAREAQAEARGARRARRRIAAPPEPASLAYLAFRKAHPATWHEDGGEPYYTHDMVHGQAFTRAKAATEHAFQVWVARARIAIEPPPAERLRFALVPELVPEDVDQVAEDEARVGEQQVEARRA